MSQKTFALWWLSFSLVSAQWVHYRTEGVPRKADGTLKANAPAPRAANGKPDLSGMWWIAGEHRPCPESIGGEADCAEKGLGLTGQQGAGARGGDYNIALDLPTGLPYQPWAADLVKTRGLTPGIGDPHVRCLPSSVIRMYTLPHMLKFVQTPKLLVILNEYNTAYRQIHIDGRPLPEDPVPSWNGYSTAHWEKDTLVVETIGFRDDLWLDMRGNPLTSAAKVTERIRRPNFGSLEIDVTVDDPKAYTKPWSVHLSEFLVVDTEMMDEVCAENEKSSAHMKQ